ncbi:biotin--[acetyl-CoA-carboxylase] ligase [Sinimarinibacterium sp. CAU 1509]|uniref:biotin--[acetyl-CoA-carboxylase] ligase n=1 Tax=Sinimarinibacterium sp. CAU 1509 TaxID=2562283 RepID=UPI0010ABC3EE|nr:biotin--[acetyl-CoA-carboxylase] ligase [Sinimarinibacterium sp. CAU 1509]TJY63190.1 biotin--[acetyl-CoA-carboxylase] ligase [Sinimarinibacterium sp. CAU 1509]
MAQALSETELLALVDRLADGQWHSGEDLAAASGISRAALAKRVAKLAEWQLAVEARQGLGYRLPQPIERLDPARLQAAVPQLRVQVLPVTDSTSTQVMAASAESDPQAVLAEVQTAGRGRRGRQWVSPFGAQLALSLAWSFDAMPPQLGALPLAVGVICANALRQAGLDTVGLKWPNDILVDGRKLGGILLEHRGEAGGGCRIVAGIGINLDLPAGPDAQIGQPFINLDAALAAIGRPRCGRNALAIALLRELHALFEGYGRSGFAPLAARWSELDVTRDRIVHIFRGGQGSDASLEGYARGVDADGALIVESDGQRHVLHSGEVSLRL